MGLSLSTMTISPGQNECRDLNTKRDLSNRNGSAEEDVLSFRRQLSPVPRKLSVTFGITMKDRADNSTPSPEVKRRIEDLTATEEFDTEAVQAALRQLVEDTLAGSRTGA